MKKVIHICLLGLFLVQYSTLAALAPDEIFAQASPSVVVVIATSKIEAMQGSGVVIKAEHVLTNCHVLEGQPSIEVLIDRQQYSAILTIADAPHDLCELFVPGLRAKPAAIGSSAHLKIGQRVYAIGTPRGLERTLSDGLISAIRPIDDYNLIQTTTPITHGSSGGGLFDDNGLLIGITSSGIDSGQNLNFAVPIDLAKSIQTRQVGESTPAKPNDGEKPFTPESIDAARLSVSVALSHIKSLDSDPQPVLHDLQGRMAYATWLKEMAGRITPFFPDQREREKFLNTVWYESVRAGVDTQLVLAIIDTDSHFNPAFVGKRGGRGYMQITPNWTRIIGDGDVTKLSNTSINLRYGCNILRLNIDREDGNLFLALGRYHGTRGQSNYTNAVVVAWKKWAYSEK